MDTALSPTIAGAGDVGQALYSLIAELYPICRSITGAGLRQTLRRIQQEIPIEIQEVPSGTTAFDWTVPLEWNIRDAYIKNSRGERVVDFQKSNLHVVQYSVPVRRTMSLAELRPYLHTLPNNPDWIPYRTSYYRESWGFCVSQHQLDAMADGEYEVYIDSSLRPGSLTYGECVLPGETTEEILVSCHICHPSLCNDNLSGIAVAVALAQFFASQQRHYTMRFLFVPGTIGAITWLARNESRVDRIRHGLVLTGVGDRGPLTYKKSRQESSLMDRAAQHVLTHSGRPFQVLEFSPYGYDERQYCSPGFNLPMGRLSRTPHGTFPEYHTSADNLDFVTPDSLAQSFSASCAILALLQRNHTFVNVSPKCEPQLGKRGLYRALGGSADAGQSELAMLWVLNLSDGQHSLLDIAERSRISFERIAEAAELLVRHGLLKSLPGSAQVAAGSAAGRTQ